MNNIIALGSAFLIVILNGLIGHFFAPSGITLTPIILVSTSLLVGFVTKNIKVIMISLLTFLFVALNDISIKLYSGGSHDAEGKGWIHFFLFMGLVPTFLILIIAIFKRKEEKLFNKIMAILIFVSLVLIHLKLFSNLG